MHSNEDILKDALLDEAVIQFNITEEWQFIPYFLFRKRIAWKETTRSFFPIDYVSLGRFILDEFGVDVSEEQLICARGTFFPASASFGTTFRMVMENLWFQTTLKQPVTEKEWDKKAHNLLRLAKKNTPVNRRHPMYQPFMDEQAYGFLKQAFDAYATGDCGDNFLMEEDAWWKPTREEKATRYIESYRNTLQKDEGVSEEDLERYLMRHLDVIEEGLTIIGSQVVLPHGRIDLLARNKQGQDVIFEVKVEKDTDLIWQRMYYESEWTKQHAQPLMVVVTTVKLDESIKEMLKEVGDTLVLEVTPLVKQGVIQELAVNHRYTLSPVSELQR